MNLEFKLLRLELYEYPEANEDIASAVAGSKAKNRVIIAIDGKKLSYRKESVRLLRDIEIRG